MPYASGTASSSLTGYDMVNEIIGQIKDFLLANISHILTVASDNNPAQGSGTPRDVRFTAGNSGHKLRIYAYSTTQVRFEIRNLADGNYLMYEVVNANNQPIHLVYGNTGFAFRFATNYVEFFSCQDTSGNTWVGKGIYVYPKDSDSSSYLAIGSPYKRTPAGIVALLPGRLENDAVYFPHIYAVQGESGWALGSVFIDTNNTYYMLIYYNSSNYSGALLEEG